MAKDADVQDIKDKVTEINKNLSNGVKVNGNSFNHLKAIVEMETSLKDVSENTQHISENLDTNGAIFQIIDKIREEASGIKGLLDGNNQHNTSQSTSSNGVSISNASGGQQSFGGFSDVINKIYDELRNFRSDVVTILGEIPEGLGPNAEFEDIKNYLQKVANAKEQISKEQKAREDNEKTQKDYWKKQKQQRKAEEKAKRKGERDAGEIAWKHAGHLVNLGTSIAQGVTSDQVLNNTVGKISGALSNLGPWGAVAGGALQGIKALFDLYAKQDKEASDYARTIGGSRFGKNQMIQVANRTVGMAPAKYGLNQEDIIKQAKELAETLGRSVSDLSSQSLISAAILKKMGVSTETIGNFDTFGKSVQQTDTYFTDLYKQVSKRGISFKNVSKAVNDNLKAAQTYTFANGLKSLTTMAEKSTQLKFNIQQTMRFADKVSDFEGAIKAAADLSVLGGTFSHYANPMQMMYESLNDPEALQKRMVSMFSGMAFFDTKTKQMDLNAVDRRRIKFAAEAAGLDFNEMTSLALNEGKFRHIENQISNKSQFDEETLEYIKNLAEINEKGQGYITLNGKETLLSDLTKNDAATIRNEARAKEDKMAATMGDIFVHTKSISETLDDMLKYLQTKMGAWVAKIAGVKFADNTSKGYWKEIAGTGKRKELKEKYGSRAQAKLAVGMGTETETVDIALSRENKRTGEKYDASLVRDYIDYKISKSNISAKEAYHNWTNGVYDSDFKNWERKRFTEKKSGGIIQGNYHVDGGVPAIYDGKPVEIEKDETLFGKDVLHRYGSEFLKNIMDHNVPTISSINGAYYSPVSNKKLTQASNVPLDMPVLKNITSPTINNTEGATITNINENTLNPLSVTPTQISSQPEKISFDTFKVEIGGKIDLTSNDKTKTLDITKLSQTDLDKLTTMIYKQVYTEISKRIKHGFDKESYPFRGA